LSDSLTDDQWINSPGYRYNLDEKLQPLVAEIGWTHNLVIMERYKDNLEYELVRQYPTIPFNTGDLT